MLIIFAVCSHLVFFFCLCRAMRHPIHTQPAHFSRLHDLRCLLWFVFFRFFINFGGETASATAGGHQPVWSLWPVDCVFLCYIVFVLFCFLNSAK